jgi:hypothetical protein
MARKSNVSNHSDEVSAAEVSDVEMQDEEQDEEQEQEADTKMSGFKKFGVSAPSPPFASTRSDSGCSERETRATRLTVPAQYLQDTPDYTVCRHLARDTPPY